MSNLFLYTLIGNFFCLLNVFCVLTEEDNVGLFFGVVACVFYVKALLSKKD